jgi:hypothetical protein
LVDKAADRVCGNCARLVDDPTELERLLPGLLALSSAQGDSWGDQGICTVHGRLVTPELTCEDYAPRVR